MNCRLRLGLFWLLYLFFDLSCGFFFAGTSCIRSISEDIRQWVNIPRHKNFTEEPRYRYQLLKIRRRRYQHVPRILSEPYSTNTKSASSFKGRSESHQLIVTDKVFSLLFPTWNFYCKNKNDWFLLLRFMVKQFTPFSDLCLHK